MTEEVRKLRREQSEIARLLGCDDWKEISTPSNLPNLVRDLVHNRTRLQERVDAMIEERQEEKQEVQGEQ